MKPPSFSILTHPSTVHSTIPDEDMRHAMVTLEMKVGISASSLPVLFRMGREVCGLLGPPGQEQGENESTAKSATATSSSGIVRLNLTDAATKLEEAELDVHLLHKIFAGSKMRAVIGGLATDLVPGSAAAANAGSAISLSDPEKDYVFKFAMAHTVTKLLRHLTRMFNHAEDMWKQRVSMVVSELLADLLLHTVSPAPRGRRGGLSRRGGGVEGADNRDGHQSVGTAAASAGSAGESVVSASAAAAGGGGGGGATGTSALSVEAAPSSTSQHAAAIPGIEKPDLFILSAAMLGVETMHRMLVGSEAGKATDPIVGVAAVPLLRLLRCLDGASQDVLSCHHLCSGRRGVTYLAELIVCDYHRALRAEGGNNRKKGGKKKGGNLPSTLLISPIAAAALRIVRNVSCLALTEVPCRTVRVCNAQCFGILVRLFASLGAFCLPSAFAWPRLPSSFLLFVLIKLCSFTQALAVWTQGENLAEALLGIACSGHVGGGTESDQGWGALVAADAISEESAEALGDVVVQIIWNSSAVGVGLEGLRQSSGDLADALVGIARPDEKYDQMRKRLAAAYANAR